MTAKHTPGPWRATPDLTEGAYGPSWTIRVDRRAIVASVSGAALHRGPEQSEANAKLIAAAPDMLAALKDLVTIARVHDVAADDPFILKALAAIAKAEGRASAPMPSGDHIAAQEADLTVRHDLAGFYVLTMAEADYEDEGNPSAGFDGRPHYATIAEAWAAAAAEARKP